MLYKFPGPLKIVKSVNSLPSKLLVVVLMHTSTAWAGRPLVTEDAGVIDTGNCEIESYIARYNRPYVNLRWMQLGCGIGLNTQISAGAGRETTRPEPATIAAASGKTSLRKLTAEQAGLAIAYSVLAGNHVDHMRHESTEIKAALTVPRQQWLLHANIGWLRSSSSTTKTTWALALERCNAIGPVDLMGEIFGDDRGAPTAQIAARWTVIPGRLFLDSSWGAQFNSAKSQQASIGLKIAF